jgi:hypothetical protein
MLNWCRLVSTEKVKKSNVLKSKQVQRGSIKRGDGDLQYSTAGAEEKREEFFWSTRGGCPEGGRGIE